MPKAKKKAVVKSAAIAKTLDSALAGLNSICDSGTKALDASAGEAKKLAVLSKRLSKKRMTLSKRKKTATARLKKDATADNRKALSAVVKELGMVTREIAKVKKVKDANNAELSGLRETVKRATAYMKGVTAADKVLNKPKRKTRRKKAA